MDSAGLRVDAGFVERFLRGSKEVPSDAEVEALLGEREAARRREDFSRSDALRDAFLTRGIMLEDGGKNVPASWKRLPVAPRGEGCMHWTRRKESFCSKPCSAGTFFCEAHETSNRGRVPCPLDPKHSVVLTKLSGHLRVCRGDGGGKTADEDDNAPPGADDSECMELRFLARRLLRALWDCGALVDGEVCPEQPGEEEFDIRTIVEISCDKEADEPGGSFDPPWPSGADLRLRPRPLEVLLPPCFEVAVAALGPDVAAGKQRAQKAEKHALQQASIAGHLERAGWLSLLDGNCGGVETCVQKIRARAGLCLVEFGAGTAQLSSAIASASREAVEQHVLVDRQGARRCADHGLGSGDTASAVRRVQCDIGDLDLRSALRAECKHVCGADAAGSVEVIGVGKHVCGAATDLTLRCCAGFVGSAGDGVAGVGAGGAADSRLRGVALALCCHHVCSWSSFVGQEWLVTRGISQQDFDGMRRFCKLAHSQYKQRSSPAPAPVSEAARAAAARAELGHLSKRLLDEARSAWLRGLGWRTRLLRFVPRSVSPENALLLAWPPGATPLTSPTGGNGQPEAKRARHEEC